jgi:hypothetical protein
VVGSRSGSIRSPRSSWRSLAASNDPGGGRCISVPNSDQQLGAEARQTNLPGP